MLLDNSQDLNDTDEVVYYQRRGIDRSLGYLVGGAVVISFFLLSILGMRRVQDLSDHAVSAHRPAPEPASAEINDSTVDTPARDE